MEKLNFAVDSITTPNSVATTIIIKQSSI